MKSFQNATTVEVTSNRDNFTKHGLHLNRKGKEQAAKTIVSSIKEIFKLQKKDLIKMSCKEQKLEGANTVSNNVDKDDDQIIHEKQANRDQEKKGKLSSKRARRLPTTRNDDFFLWLDINMNQ
jgi:ATP phosphoribosyltransferase